MKKIIFLFLSFIILSCNTSKEDKKDTMDVPKPEIVEKPVLNLEQANRLAQLPLHCASGILWLF